MLDNFIAREAMLSLMGAFLVRLLLKSLEEEFI